MKRKFISALLFGALCITPSSVLVSCDDYDSDIENLQQQITANAQTLEQLSGEKQYCPKRFSIKTKKGSKGGVS